MRIILLSMVATGALFAFGADGAQAGKWCTDGNMQCYYSTLKECQADAAGTAGDCTINPSYKYTRLRGPLKKVQ